MGSKQWYRGPMHKVVGMTVAETELAEKYIEGKQEVLEWGCGGSTLYFPEMVENYTSIEHNPGWHARINSTLPDNVELYLEAPTNIIFDDELDSVAESLLRFYTKGVKKSSKDGRMYWQNRGRVDWHQTINYIKKPVEFKKTYDVVFIDGRSRIFCAYTAQRLVNEDGFVLMHDFNNRYMYESVLDYYDVVETEDTLAVLKLKK